MKTYSFYSIETGLFVGRKFRGHARHLEANTPAGCKYVEGSFDPTKHRIENGSVVERVRSQVELDAEIRAARAGVALEKIEALELQQLRPLRELAIDQDNPIARARVTEINAEIAELRKRL